MRALDVQDVTRRTRDEAVAEHAAKLRDGVVQRGDRVARRRPRPQLVDDAIPRDDLVRVQQEQDQERAQLLRRQLERAAAVLDLERPQDAVFGHANYL